MDVSNNISRLLRTVSLSVLLLMGCGSEIKEETALPPVLENQPETLKLLCLGNSYTSDAMAYVPFIYYQLTGCNIQLGILYKGGCTLAKHHQAWLTDSRIYTYYWCDANQGHWEKETRTCSFREVLSNDNWDIVTFQQFSNDSGNYETFQPYLNELITYTRQCDIAQTAWLLTPPRATVKDTNVAFLNICEATKTVCAECDIDIVFPAGTAIQNARNTILNNLGDAGELTSDRVHLQDGLPSLIEAYVICQILINFQGIKNCYFSDDNTDITLEWCRQHATPNMNGIPTGMTEENRIIAIQCIEKALSAPFQLSFNK